jgi:hypothetical protein
MKYFSNLEFLPATSMDDVELGPQGRRERWTMRAYLMFSLGIVARQLIPYPKVIVEATNLRWSVLVASLLIGLALFPPIMRWLNRKRRRPSFEHLVTAFSVGFFVNLATAGVALATRAARLFT